MFEVIVTEDFINVIMEMPLRYIDILVKSFVSVKKIENEEEVPKNNTFLNDLMEQIKNQEME